MNTALRIAGLAAPWLLGFGWVWLETRLEPHAGNLPPDGPGSALVLLLALGGCTGLLLRTWWALVYPPVTVAVIVIVTGVFFGRDAAFEFGTYTVESAVVELLVLALLSLPYALGAAIGVFAGQGIETALEERRWSSVR